MKEINKDKYGEEGAEFPFPARVPHSYSTSVFLPTGKLSKSHPSGVLQRRHYIGMIN